MNANFDRFQAGDVEDDSHFCVTDEDESELEKGDMKYDLSKGDLE